MNVLTEVSIFPVHHSILAPAALLYKAVSEYDIGEPVECQLLSSWLNDTYLVRTTIDKYVLRVYRAGWRTLSDICYEFDVLDHLACKSVSISVPLTGKDGRRLATVNAPEGKRCLALFTFAHGEELTHQDQQSYLYGRAAAVIHRATDEFVSSHARFAIDLSHLIDEPLAATLPLLARRPDDQAYLQNLAEKIRVWMGSMPTHALDPGFCFGDFHGGNAHIADDQRLTFFDFDCCGPGWRLYDIAVFRWGLQFWLEPERHAETWAEFLRGYQEERSLQAYDLTCIPWFVAARVYWFLGLVANKTREVGIRWAETPLFYGQLTYLRKWEAEYLT